MYKTRTYQDFTLATGEEIELEPQYTPIDWIKPTIVEAGNYIIFGYMSHDSDCMNPLEDCDAMGVIHHHPRSNYGRRDSDYYDVLGMDQYGEPDLDAVFGKHDAVVVANYIEACLREKDMADLMTWAEEHYDRVEEDEIGSDTVFVRNCLKQDIYEIGWDRCEYWEVAESVLRQMWHEDTYFPGDPDAVLLDLYEHGGCCWSVSGDGMQCRWDTSRGESVWVPDKYLRQELEKIADPQERRTRAVEYAEQACETYTSWVNGDCYGVVVQVHEQDGTFVEEEACWGYIGGECAEESLAEQVKWAVARYEEEALPKNPNQMEMSI